MIQTNKEIMNKMTPLRNNVWALFIKIITPKLMMGMLDKIQIPVHGQTHVVNLTKYPI